MVAYENFHMHVKKIIIIHVFFFLQAKLMSLFVQDKFQIALQKGFIDQGGFVQTVSLGWNE